MALGESVDERLQQVGPLVPAPVIGLVKSGILEAEVRAEVDDLRRERRETVDAAGGLAMGEAEEQHLAWFELRDRAELEARGLAQVRVRILHEFSGESFRRAEQRLGEGVVIADPGPRGRDGTGAAGAALRPCSRNPRRWIPTSRGGLHDVVDNLSRYVDTGGLDAIPEFHRVVDLVDL